MNISETEIFVCGGRDEDDVTNRSFAFNIESQVHDQKANMITGRWLHAITLSDQNIYVFGGAGSTGDLDSCERFSIEKNEWTSLPPLPWVEDHTFAVVYNGEIWVAGWSGRISVFSIDNMAHRVHDIFL